MSIDFEALFSISPNPYVVLDTDLRMVWMNEAYLRVTVRNREDILGVKMFEAFPSAPESESHRLLEGSLERVLRTGRPDELALIRYDIRNSDGSMDVRYWSATHTPLLGSDGAVRFILQHTVDVTELHGLRTLRDEAGIVERATRIQARNLDLAAESQQLKSLVEQAPGFVAILSGADHRFQLANQAYQELVGTRDLIGRTVAEALPEVVDQGFLDLLDSVHRSGTPYIGRREQVRIDKPGEGSGDQRYLDFIYQPILTEGGQVSGIFVQGIDVTDQVEAEDRQKLLVNELNHRVKNTLAIVQGLASQSFKQVDPTAPARQTFEARLNALASAHNLLTSQQWESADVGETIEKSVGASAGADVGRVRFAGPQVTLGPQAALSLAMITHELTTNAIKYGALSVPDGRVSVDWAIGREGDRRLLTIDWVERGGPTVVAPQRRGFGTRLIERGLSSELHSQVAMNFAPEGLECRITAGLADEV